MMQAQLGSLRGAQARSIASSRPANARRPLVVRAAIAAAPVSVPVKSVGGGDAGEETLALNVAPAGTAKGLVHRYLVYVQQNARRVRDERQRMAIVNCFCPGRELPRMRRRPSDASQSHTLLLGHGEHAHADRGARRWPQALQAEGHRWRAPRQQHLAALPRRRHQLWPQGAFDDWLEVLALGARGA